MKLRGGFFPTVLPTAFLIWSCSSTTPHDAAPSRRGPSEGPSRGGPALSSAPPFPEAVDTLSWDLAGPADSGNPGEGESDNGSGHHDSGNAPVRTRPLAQTLPPVSRPEGIVQKPRPKDLPDKVHVLLMRTAKPLSLYSLGEMQVLAEGVAQSGESKSVAVSRLLNVKGRFVIRRAGAGFAIEQGNRTLQTTSARRLRLISVNPYNLIDLGGAVYRGGMHILSESDGGIAAVNVLGVEDYLRGVLPYELGTVDREALEALKALAVVARTYAYKRMLRASGQDFQLYSDVQDQVYKGVRGEYLLSDRAVWETRGMAVCHADTLAVCYYFSTCGGRTASKHEVWGGDSIPYLVSRPDTDGVGEPFCQASKYNAWTQEWTQPQLAGILRRNLRSAGVSDFPSFSTVLGFDVLQRASCGRIRTLRINTDRGPVTVKGDKVRFAMRVPGSDDKILPSAFFNVKVAGGKVTAQGKGFGHGVGLCQTGAIARARANQNYLQIIQAYYTGVKVVEFR